MWIVENHAGELIMRLKASECALDSSSIINEIKEATNKIKCNAEAINVKVYTEFDIGTETSIAKDLSRECYE